MRTFHTGGIAGAIDDITQGLPRVEELFESRVPKDKAIVSEIDGVVEIHVEDNGARKLKRGGSTTSIADEYPLPKSAEVLVQRWRSTSRRSGDRACSPTRRSATGSDREVTARTSGTVDVIAENRLVVHFEERDEREYPLPAATNITVADR